jgi:hypothetical protein
MAKKEALSVCRTCARQRFCPGTTAASRPCGRASTRYGQTKPRKKTKHNFGCASHSKGRSKSVTAIKNDCLPRQARDNSQEFLAWLINRNGWRFLCFLFFAGCRRALRRHRHHRVQVQGGGDARVARHAPRLRRSPRGKKPLCLISYFKKRSFCQDSRGTYVRKTH